MPFNIYENDDRYFVSVTEKGYRRVIEKETGQIVRYMRTKEDMNEWSKKYYQDEKNADKQNRSSFFRRMYLQKLKVKPQKRMILKHDIKAIDVVNVYNKLLVEHPDEKELLTERYKDILGLILKFNS